MNTIVKKATVVATAAGAGMAIDKAAPKRHRGVYPSVLQIVVTAVSAVSVTFVAAFLERKLGLSD